MFRGNKDSDVVIVSNKIYCFFASLIFISVYVTTWNMHSQDSISFIEYFMHIINRDVFLIMIYIPLLVLIPNHTIGCYDSIRKELYIEYPVGFAVRILKGVIFPSMELAFFLILVVVMMGNFQGVRIFGHETFYVDVIYTDIMFLIGFVLSSVLLSLLIAVIAKTFNGTISLWIQVFMVIVVFMDFQGVLHFLKYINPVIFFLRASVSDNFVSNILVKILLIGLFVGLSFVLIKKIFVLSNNKKVSL